MVKRARLVIIGATGLLGPYFSEEFASRYEVINYGRTKGDLRADLTDLDVAKTLFGHADPDIVINLAAYTDVDGCADHPEVAKAINVKIPANIAAAISDHVQLVQISTDQVYPDSKGPHKEKNIGPVNAYGQTKLDGEKAALTHSNTLVLRTNIFGKSKTEGRKSLSDFFEESFRCGKPIKLFNDSIFTPLHMRTLAAITNQMLRKTTAGVYNVGSREALSKADFALAVARHLELSAERTEITSSTSIFGRSKRALDLALDVAKIEKVLTYSMPTLHEEVRTL